MFDKLKGSMTGLGGGGIEGHLETVQALVREKVGPAAKEIAKDEEKLKAAFKMVYPALPMPVRLIVTEDKFVEFCLTHKDKVLPPEALS